LLSQPAHDPRSPNFAKASGVARCAYNWAFSSGSANTLRREAESYSRFGVRSTASSASSSRGCSKSNEERTADGDHQPETAFKTWCGDLKKYERGEMTAKKSAGRDSRRKPIHVAGFRRCADLMKIA